MRFNQRQPFQINEGEKEDELLRINFEEVASLPNQKIRKVYEYARASNAVIERQIDDFLSQYKVEDDRPIDWEIFKVCWALNGKNECLWSFSAAPSVRRNGVAFYQTVDEQLISVNAAVVYAYTVRDYAELKWVMGESFVEKEILLSFENITITDLDEIDPGCTLDLREGCTPDGLFYIYEDGGFSRNRVRVPADWLAKLLDLPTPPPTAVFARTDDGSIIV